MTVLAVGTLAPAPMAAAAEFYARIMPQALAALGAAQDDLVIGFAPADHTHRGWRLAAVQELARAAVPLRVNAIESDDRAAIAAAVAFLDGAPGVTGQLLRLDSQGAGVVVG